MAVHAPSGLVVTVISSSRIDLTWKNNDNYDRIRIYRGKGNTEGDAIAALAGYRIILGSKEYMEDSGLEADEWYAYKIYGYVVHPYAASDFSNTATGETLLTLSAPTLVVATPISDTKIDLTFKDNSSEEKWHRVQRKLGGGGYGNVVDLEPNREFYRDTGLAADSLYTYKVHAMQEEGDLGTYALESAQVVTFDKPTAPVLAAILDADTQDKSIRIRWPGVVEGLWKTATLYHVNDWIENDGISYICILQHTSDAAKEPGIGINWITNWEVVTGYRIEHFIWYVTAFWSQTGLVAYDGTKVNDGVLNVNAFHTDTSGANSFLKIDLGAGNDKEFMRVDITIIGTPANAIWDVEYSDNDSDWFKAKEDVGGAPLAVGTHEFAWSGAGAHRYWKLLKTNAATAGGYHAEVQFYEQTEVVGSGITDFLFTGLDPGIVYKFKMRAYNAAGDSAYSNIVSKDALSAYVFTEFEKWIRDPNIEPVYLAEIYTKMTLDTFTPTDGRDKTFQRTIEASDRGIDILEVFEGDEVTDPDNPTYVSYTAVGDADAVQATAKTFWFDYANRILYVHTSDDSDPDAGPFLIEAAFWLYFSTHKDIEFNDNFYLPLLAKEDIPDITQEIKPYFEGSFSISSGSIAFMNAKIGGEHFFDKKFSAYTWINAKVILKAGSNVSPVFTYAQFKEIFTSYIDQKSCTDAKITFQLRDVRKEMTQPIILNKFNTTDYPDIEDTFVGKLIPAIFGFRDLTIPIPIDMENQHFKFNDSSIGTRSGSVERVEKNDVELVENTHFYADLQRSVLTFDRDGRFIVDATNNKINFKEGEGGEITVTLDSDTYTTKGLCDEIKAKMDASAGTFTYTVGPTDIPATPPKKFTIAAGADEVFSLLWKTGTNGAGGTNTHIGSTIGFYDDEDSEGEDNYEADDDVITIQKGDIIKVSCKGFVNSADETIDNGAEIFKYLMNNYKGIQDSELNLDSIYATKSAKPNVLALPIESEPSFDEIVRTIEHSMEAYTFQDELGRLGIKPQQTVVASNVKYVISKQIFDHVQSKDRSTLFWKVNVYYNKDYDDNWEVKTATKNEIKWQYRVTKELPIDTYFTSSSHAADLAESILSLLNKERIENTLPMLLFDVMAGDLIKFSRVRFYDSDGTASEITLRVIRISKSPASGRTSITAEAI